MAFKKLVLAVAVFTLFAGGALAAYQVADLGQKAAPANERTAVNESIVIEYDSYQFVDNATKQYTAGFNNTVTVYYNGSELSTNDYDWNSTDGTITFTNNANTTEGDTANITYTYYENTQNVKEVSGPLGTVTEAIGQTGFLVGGIALVIFLLAFGSVIAAKLTNSGPKTNR